MRDHLSARLRAGLACLVLLLLSTAGPALAHQDDGAARTERAGPYQVLAFDGVRGGVADEVDYTVIVQDAAGLPVDGADVAVSAQPTDASTDPTARIGPMAAQSVANVYRFTLPDLGSAAWNVEVTVSSGAGPGSAAFVLHAPNRLSDAVVVLDDAQPRANVSPLPVIAIVGGAVVVVAILALSVGRGAKATATEPTDQHV